jgi:hypothetical protein
MIRMELDTSIKGDLAVVQVPWYIFDKVDRLFQGANIVVLMGHTGDYLVVAGNPARVYEVAGMLHEALHQLHKSEVDLD